MLKIEAIDDSNLTSIMVTSRGSSKEDKAELDQMYTILAKLTSGFASTGGYTSDQSFSLNFSKSKDKNKIG